MKINTHLRLKSNLKKSIIILSVIILLGCNQSTEDESLPAIKLQTSIIAPSTTQVDIDDKPTSQSTKDKSLPAIKLQTSIIASSTTQVNIDDEPTYQSTEDKSLPAIKFQTSIIASSTTQVDINDKPTSQSTEDKSLPAIKLQTSIIASSTSQIDIDDKPTSCTSNDDTLDNEVPPTNKLQLNINFQPVNTQIPRDYLVDTGLPFANRGNGYSYGWSSEVSEGARDRNHNNAKDQRYDTLLHMLHPPLAINDYWEIKLPNNNYQVKLIAGDPEYCDELYRIAVEDEIIINGAPGCSHFIENTINVSVTDGYLTMTTLADSKDAKVAFIEITEINDQPDLAPPSTVYNEKITAMNNQLLVEWQNPLYDFAGTLIIYDTKPIDFLPKQNTDCSNFESIQGANLMALSTDSRAVLSSLENGQEYYINILSFDESFNYANAVKLTNIPQVISPQKEKEISETLMETLQAGNKPDVVYDTFESFAKTHFGALVTPQIYEKFGNSLKILEESKWQHISKYSAVIAWETNLPAKTSIEYNKQGEEQQSTEISERYFYNHLHYLKNLAPDTVYVYRMRSTDEKQQTIITAGTFTTGLQGEVIEIPGDLGEPPYTLDKSNVTYLLTQNITADSGAINLKGGPVTLDLGGNTITFANTLHDEYDVYDMNKNGMGIFRHNNNYPEGKVFITNGFIQQSDTENAPVTTGGFNPVYIGNQKNFEIAGISINYHTPQTYGMYLRYPKGEVNLHHNSFTDRGSSITNRHGSSGGRSVYFQYSEAGVNNYSIHHNLVKRTRQNGFSEAQNIYNNEIYVDSWSTNSFAIQPHSENGIDAGTITENKVFLTGYHAIGISWAHENLLVDNNFIHMEGINTAKNRWYESFGDQNSLNGLRLTNYGAGGQIRNNLRYANNLLIGNARHGSMIRGTELFSDYSITNTLVDNSVIEINAEDEETTRVSAVVTQGTASEESKPTYYKDTILSSNIANVRFGDNYGRGYNHHFYSVTFNKVGDNPNYHTFIFDGGYSRDGHVIRDPIFTNGARYDDVYWERTGDLSAYSIEWTLTIQAEVGEEIEIYDVNNNLVFNGIINDKGKVHIPLTEVTIRPKQWTIDSHGSGVNDKSEHQKIIHTPHRIVLPNKPNNELAITINEIKTIKL
jgi:hypothetical protein